MTEQVARLTVRGGDDRIIAPLKSDGTSYRYELIHEDGRRRSYADDVTTLTAEMIDGYAAADDEAGRLGLRIRYARHAQIVVQAQLIAGYNGPDLTASQRQILYADRENLQAADWDAPIPLVLLTTDYQSVAKPTAISPSGIIWIDPSDEFGLLLSLANAGHLGLAERTESDPPGSPIR